MGEHFTQIDEAGVAGYYYSEDLTNINKAFLEQRIERYSLIFKNFNHTDEKGYVDNVLSLEIVLSVFGTITRLLLPFSLLGLSS